MDTRVFIARCEEYDQAAAAVNRILGAFGGTGAVLNGRKRVLVKPNLSSMLRLSGSKNKRTPHRH